jgi:hypothetical protein
VSRLIYAQAEVVSPQFFAGVSMKAERQQRFFAAYCQTENKVALGFVEGLNNKIRVLQRRAYGLRNEEYLGLKILTCKLPEI